MTTVTVGIILDSAWHTVGLIKYWRVNEILKN